jgi:hypothetical protein
MVIRFGSCFLTRDLRNDLRRAAGKEEVMRIKNTLSGLGKLLLFSVLLAAVGCAGNGVTGKAEDVTPTVPPITPTVVHENGSGELLVQADSGVNTAEGGYIHAENDGTIPFTIHFNPKSEYYEITGEARGNGGNTYKHPQCEATATFWVEYVVSGVLVPAKGLVGDKGKGCYMIIKIHQEWQEFIDVVASCESTAIKGLAASPGGTKNTMGPYRIPKLGGPLFEGASGGEIIDNGTWQTEYKIKAQKLDIPQETGCIVGEILKQSK